MKNSARSLPQSSGRNANEPDTIPATTDVRGRKA
jgi:hypothetical protein